jgi:hypothetical protein
MLDSLSGWVIEPRVHFRQSLTRVLLSFTVSFSFDIDDSRCLSTDCTQPEIGQFNQPNRDLVVKGGQLVATPVS